MPDPGTTATRVQWPDRSVYNLTMKRSVVVLIVVGAVACPAAVVAAPKKAPSPTPVSFQDEARQAMTAHHAAMAKTQFDRACSYLGSEVQNQINVDFDGRDCADSLHDAFKKMSRATAREMTAFYEQASEASKTGTATGTANSVSFSFVVGQDTHTFQLARIGGSLVMVG